MYQVSYVTDDNKTVTETRPNLQAANALATGWLRQGKQGVSVTCGSGPDSETWGIEWHQ